MMKSVVSVKRCYVSNLHTKFVWIYLLPEQLELFTFNNDWYNLYFFKILFFISAFAIDRDQKFDAPNAVSMIKEIYRNRIRWIWSISYRFGISIQYEYLVSDKIDQKKTEKRWRRTTTESVREHDVADNEKTANQTKVSTNDLNVDIETAEYMTSSMSTIHVTSLFELQ